MDKSSHPNAKMAHNSRFVLLPSLRSQEEKRNRKVAYDFCHADLDTFRDKFSFVLSTTACLHHFGSTSFCLLHRNSIFVCSCLGIHT
jgi:hypothetical protein